MVQSLCIENNAFLLLTIGHLLVGYDIVLFAHHKMGIDMKHLSTCMWPLNRWT